MKKTKFQPGQSVTINGQDATIVSPIGRLYPSSRLTGYSVMINGRYQDVRTSRISRMGNRKFKAGHAAIYNGRAVTIVQHIADRSNHNSYILRYNDGKSVKIRTNLITATR